MAILRYAFGIAFMVGLYYLIHWLVSISVDFGRGMFVGAAMMLGLMIIAMKVAPERFIERP